MYEAHAAVVGTVITDPVRRRMRNDEEVLSFRMASNARRQDRVSGEWVDSGTLYLSVSCFRRLVDNTDASIGRGDPIIAYGQLRTNRYTTRDGIERTDLEMRANAIGPDLARCVAVVRRHEAKVTSISAEPAEEPATDSDPTPLQEAVGA
ncbi:single-stranded DNA-binding protein [Aldersonia sp. NBC_00410]|uniref:single-stranded DNA-binding protein n=1 Tax=Aldersonia sp. NBC_00410 TaxID=2975954 RepID=UPI00224DB697|nr:single-stranded DNA-binding protein [Aldersonia sp. NBC_00410]MCX5042819.1 single-stranded DNA-binding protein [Aldersonia sp. NBC_00410]